MRGDYTLAEVKEICKAKKCAACRFKTPGRKMCQFETAPQFWDLSESVLEKEKKDG